MKLHGERIVVTRPAGQADALLAQLQAEGAEALGLPLLAIDALGPQDAAWQHALDCFNHLAVYQHAIFISTNAVQHGLAALACTGHAWPAGLAVHAIGRATARALADAGIVAGEAEGKMDSEALLALPALQGVAGQKVLLVRGEGGRSHLASTLRNRGASVDIAETYRRRCPNYPAATIQATFLPAPAAIVVNSGETLKNLAVYVQGMATVRQSLLVVPSERVASLAQALGFPHVITAANASDAAIMDALRTADKPQ